MLVQEGRVSPIQKGVLQTSDAASAMQEVTTDPTSGGASPGTPVQPQPKPETGSGTSPASADQSPASSCSTLPMGWCGI